MHERRGDGVGASLLALLAQTALQTVVGVILARAYVPTVGSAYLSTENLPAFLRAVHYWGSALLILHGIAHIAYCLLKGRAASEDRLPYLSALLLTFAALGFQLTGNLLPYDRHGVQTAAVEGAIAGGVPAIGPAVADLIRNGPVVGQGTLDLWYVVHRYALPILLVVALALFIRRPERARLSPWPAVAAVLGLATLSFSLPAPLASRATAEDGSRFDALSSWYSWPAHGSLVLWNKLGGLGGLGWFGAVGIVGIVALGTLAMAWAAPKVGRIWAGAVGLYLAVCALGFGGSFAPLVGRRDPPTPVAEKAVKQISVQDKILAARGAKLFGSEGCENCHGAKGLKGVAGPSLARTYERHPDADYFERYIKNPQAVKKGSVMPAYPDLKADELKALAEYLRFPR